MWNEAQLEVRRTAARFVRDKLPVAHLRQLRDTRDPTGFSRASWRELAELGLVGLALPEKLGGGGLGFRELGLVLIERLERRRRGPDRRADHARRPTVGLLVDFRTDDPDRGFLDRGPGSVVGRNGRRRDRNEPPHASDLTRRRTKAEPR